MCKKAFNLTLHLIYKDIPDVKNILSKKIIKLHWHRVIRNRTKTILKHKIYWELRMWRNQQQYFFLNISLTKALLCP